MRNAATDLTGALARFTSTLRLADVPDNVKAEGRRLILDTLGCMISATRTRMAPIAYGSADFLGDGNVASIVGRKQRASLAAALYANGRLANCMDLDETFPPGFHFGVGAVVGALALAEALKASGSQFLQAVIAGYELGGRVASAAHPNLKVSDSRVDTSQGLFSFSVSVVFAAAGAAIQLEGHDDRLARQTLGLAGTNTPVPFSSKYQQAQDIPDCKYEDAGWSALAGVFSARSAALGATGFTDMFDGDRGLLRMCGIEKFDSDYLIGELGSRWMLADITYKPWPTCRWTHHPMTALAKAAAKAKFDARQIESVVLETHHINRTIRFNNTAPRTFCSRQFSIQHGSAMLLLGIPVGPAWLDEAQDRNPEVRALREKIHIEEWDRGNAFGQYLVRGGVRNMPARAIITLRDGTRLEGETDFALGDPWTSETAWGDEQVAEKFRAVSGLSAAHANAVIRTVLDIESQPDVDFIASVLRDA